MNTTNQSTPAPFIFKDEIYETYGKSGFSLVLFLLVSVKSLVALSGFLSNLFLVFVTMKHKSLHGSCNILIALNSLCCALFELSGLAAFGITITGLNFIPMDICSYILFLPLTGANCNLIFSLFIGIDRLLCIFAPFL
uniref:G-protein coupled receptors family 1 profile domain-containing protein n=1 Tax=Ditylenchus dipsaci TaxID=166011 RepID=A0A915E7V4_9BILA